MGVFVGVKKYGDRNVIDLSEWGRKGARVSARFWKEKRIDVIQVQMCLLYIAPRRGDRQKSRMKEAA